MCWDFEAKVPHQARHPEGLWRRGVCHFCGENSGQLRARRSEACPPSSITSFALMCCGGGREGSFFENFALVVYEAPDCHSWPSSQGCTFLSTSCVSVAPCRVPCDFALDVQNGISLGLASLALLGGDWCPLLFLARCTAELLLAPVLTASKGLEGRLGMLLAF